jgi:[ribosomal protein S18]-alanine N-acetyltransferase
MYMESYERPEKQPVAISMHEVSEADMEVLIDIERSVPETNTYSPMLTARAWKEELAENTVEIIKLGDFAVGSIAYKEKSPNHIYISGIIVRPEYQGRGIATNAIQSVLAKYPDAERIDLVTHPDNPALKLYESIGFKVEERKENYFGDGEPRLVLALTREINK